MCKFERVWFIRTPENETFLGDDFLADNDSSYLDIETPNAPTANPSEDLADTDEFGLPRIPESAKWNKILKFLIFALSFEELLFPAIL